MPRLDGIEVTSGARRSGRDPPDAGLVVTTFDLDEYVYGALRGGAVGFILKDVGPTMLVETVRAVHNGDALVSPSVTVRLLRHLNATGEPTAAVPASRHRCQHANSGSSGPSPEVAVTRRSPPSCSFP